MSTYPTSQPCGKCSSYSQQNFLSIINNSSTTATTRRCTTPGHWTLQATEVINISRGSVATRNGVMSAFTENLLPSLTVRQILKSDHQLAKLQTRIVAASLSRPQHLVLRSIPSCVSKPRSRQHTQVLQIEITRLHSKPSAGIVNDK